MAGPETDLRSAQKARARALIIPREHGAWGLLLVPLFTGAASGIAANHEVWPVVWFTLAVLALFWLRTPAESLLGGSPLRAQTASERKAAILMCAFLAVIASACLAALMMNGRHRGLFLFGVIVGLILLVQAVLKKLSRKLRMEAEIVGALGLTCVAPAAYYVATGQIDVRAWGLWAANGLFAGNQIHFVHLRVHAARAATFAEKFSQGRWFFLNQMLMLPALLLVSRAHYLPGLTAIAFVPLFIRGVYWFVRGPAPLKIKRLGWSEMAHGILFGFLLAVAFNLSRR